MPIRSIAVVAIAVVGLTTTRVANAASKAATPDAAGPETVQDVFSRALWEDRAKVTAEELFAQLDIVADDRAKSEAARAAGEALVAAHDLEDNDALFRDYVRVKLAFETTRDAGWWHLHWRITNGLFWPTWNHVVAVWTVQSKDGPPVRIVGPTSQIFLGTDDSLGTEGFDPWTLKTIDEYRRRDVRSRHRLDADLARFFVRQAARHGRKSQATLQAERNARDTQIVAALSETNE